MEIIEETDTREQIIPLDIENNKISINKELEPYLKTKVKNLPPEYLFLFKGMVDDYMEATLLDTLTEFAKLYNEDIKFYFSKSGEKVTGAFICRARNKKEVILVKGESFDVSKNNPVLGRDYIRIIQLLLTEYERVHWWGIKGHPVNFLYQRLVKMFNGHFKEEDKKFDYYIDRKNVCMDV